MRVTEETTSSPEKACSPLRKFAELAVPVLVAITLFLLIRQTNLRGIFGMGASPAIAIEPAKFACEAREGDTVTAAFQVRNLTRQTVKLLGADLSCGCFISNGLPLTLASGEMAQISFEVEVGEPTSGNVFERRIQLFASVPDGFAVPSPVVEATVQRRSH